MYKRWTIYSLLVVEFLEFDKINSFRIKKFFWGDIFTAMWIEGNFPLKRNNRPGPIKSVTWKENLFSSAVSLVYHWLIPIKNAIIVASLIKIRYCCLIECQNDKQDFFLAVRAFVEWFRSIALTA